MNRRLLYILLLIISSLIISAEDFENYMDSISIYNDDYDSLLVSLFPERTVSSMEKYLQSNDYIKHFIAYRILSLYSDRDSIAHVMYAKGIGLKHILNIAASLKDDSILNNAAITGSVYEKAAYLSLLTRRNNREDMQIITGLLNDTSFSIRLCALRYLCEVDYSYVLNDSLIQYLEEHRKAANFREYIIIGDILDRIDNNADIIYENTDNDSIKTNGVNDE